MNITVYLGSSFGDDPDFKQCAIDVGKWIADNGHTLVYGGSDGGMMGDLATTALAFGAEVHGIIPEFFNYRVHPGLTTVEVVENMSIRKRKMLEMGEAFIALPGGMGTLEEISEVMSHQRIGLIHAPVVLMNINGYYDAFKQLIHDMARHEFIRPGDEDIFCFAESIEEMGEYINAYK